MSLIGGASPGESPQPHHPNEVRSEAGGMPVPGQEGNGAHPDGENVSERQAPDFGSLAIGGTIGGILAAKALRGAMGSGARGIVPAAAGYFAKRIRESNGDGSDGHGSNDDGPGSAPSSLPQQQVAAEVPATEPDRSHASERPDNVGLPEQVMGEPSAETIAGAGDAGAYAAGAGEWGEDDARQEAHGDAGELLEASAAADGRLEVQEDEGVIAEKNFEAEVLQAESELEEALYLLAADNGLGGATDAVAVQGDEAAAGGLFDEADEDPAAANHSVASPGLQANSVGRTWSMDEGATDGDGDGGASETPSPVRSPFMRDHSADAVFSQSEPRDGAAPGEGDEMAASTETVVSAETMVDFPSSEHGADPGPESGTSVQEPVADTQLQDVQVANVAPPALPALEPMAVFSEPAVAPELATGIPGPLPGWQGQEAAAPVVASPSPLADPASEPNLPPAARAPEPSLPPAPEPIANLPGISHAATELPPPMAGESRAGETVLQEPALRPDQEAGSLASFVPSPAPRRDEAVGLPSLPVAHSNLPPLASEFPAAGLPAAELPAADMPGSLTEVPLQPAPVHPEPMRPAAPLSGMEAASRPALTRAELAAKERAAKVAQKKAAAGKEKKPQPKRFPIPEPQKQKQKQTQKLKRRRKVRSSAAERVKKPQTKGSKKKLALIGLPLLALLLGAGTFAYFNKEKLGFGGTRASEPPVSPDGGVSVPTPRETPGNTNPTLTPPGLFPSPDPKVLPPENLVDEPPEPLRLTKQEIDQILLDPEKTLNAFLLVGTVDELLNFVTDREIVEPEIREYYKGGVRTPIATQSVKFDSSGLVPGTKMAAAMYWVTSLRRRIPVSVEETAAGYKVDWAAFTQFHDGKFEKFIREVGSPAGGFYVQLRRSHFFGNGMPDLDDLYAFRVRSPIAPYQEAYAFLEKKHPDAKAIIERYRWSEEYRPFVELKWVTPAAGADPRIEIVRIVRNSWRR